MNTSILNEDNYNFLINKVEANYSNIISNLNNQINENFTVIKCLEYINSEIVFENDINPYDDSFIKNCTRERYSTELNYSKYNFNIAKLRTEISNSKKLTEILEQLFDDLNYNNLIDSNEINKIDDITNNTNILNIFNETKIK